MEHRNEFGDLRRHSLPIGFAGIGLDHFGGAIGQHRNSDSESKSPIDSARGRTVLFRCDGTMQTGLGHASRSLGLAEAFVDLGYECLFVGMYDAAVQSRLQRARMPWTLIDAVSWSAADADGVIRIAEETKAIGVVLDSYLVDACYIAAIEHDAAPVLVLDDFASLPKYPCTAILNFTSRASEFSYPCSAVRCYLGPKWFLGRRALRAVRAQGTRSLQHAERVLVTAGGNDPFDVILPMVDSLLGQDLNLAVHAVIPATYPHRQELESLLTGFHGETAIFSQLSDLSGEFAWADVCLSSAGLTKYEACYLGVPTGVLSQNEGQAKDAEMFENLGMAVNLGSASSVDVTQLADRIGHLLTDVSLRKRLRHQSLHMFPTDPTRDMAERLIRDVFHDRRSSA